MKKAAGSKAAEVRGQRPEEQAEHKHLHLKTFTVMTSWSKRVTRHELMKIYAFLFVETPYLVRCRWVDSRIKMNANSFLLVHVSAHRANVVNPVRLRCAWPMVYVSRVAVELEPFPAVIGREAGYTWTGRQSITGPHRDTQPCTLTITARDSLDIPVNLTFWTVGGSRSIRREPTHTQGEHADSTQKEPAGTWTWNPLLWGDDANHHTTVQP